MKRTCFFLVSFVLNILRHDTLANKLKCEFVRDNLWIDPLGSIKTCFMETKTSISSPKSLLSPPQDAQIRSLMFSTNEKIFYLPVNVAEAFPNLIAYGAWGCSIKKISKENFKSLFSLRHLSLDGNRFEMIPFDTFEDLVLLEKLWLNNSNIKQLNGQAFVKLTSLDFIILNSNPCIDKDFYKPIDSLEIIDEQCGFCESALSSLIIESLEAELNALKSNALLTNQPVLKITDEFENLQIMNNELKQYLKQKQKENEELHEMLQDKKAEIEQNRNEVERLRNKLQALDKIIHDD